MSAGLTVPIMPLLALLRRPAASPEAVPATVAVAAPAVAPRWHLRVHLGLALLAAGLLGLNGWIFLHRQQGFLFHYRSERWLYRPEEKNSISSFKLLPHNVLQLGLSQPGILLNQLFIDDHELRLSAPLTLPLLPGLHDYVLRAHSPALMTRVHLRLETTEHTGHVDNVRVVTSNLPFGTDGRPPLSELAWSTQEFAGGDLAQARRLLPMPASLSADRARLEWLVTALQSQLRPHAGVPQPGLAQLPPLAQYHAVVTGQSALWCDNCAAIYLLFATAYGLPSRLVAVEGTLNGVHLGGHTVAETYLPDTGNWAMVDLTSDPPLLANASGRVLTAADLLQLRACCPEVTLYGGLTTGGTPVPLPGRLLTSYFQPYTTLVYVQPDRDRSSPWSRIRRYALTPESAYSLQYGPERNLLLLAAFYALVAVLGGWLAFLLVTRRSRRQAPAGAVVPTVW